MNLDPLLPWWSEAIHWFVIAGTADDDEAGAVKERFPSVHCLGVEANEELYNAQLLRFPGRLIHAALWDEDDLQLELSWYAKRPRSGSVCAPQDRPDYQGADWQELSLHQCSQPVRTVTLDTLSDRYGPFEDCFLWLDVEYAELRALQGAARLLDRVRLLNVETFAHLNLSPIVKLLRQHGLYLADVWNVGPTAGKDAQDYIFVR